MDSPVTVEERVAQAVEALQARRRVPHATYRVQMNENFTFRDTLALVPYLDALGISDLYLSPIFKARPGSTHGYDVCDYSELNPVLGTWEDFRALAAALRERDMGLLLDMVPNHMGIMSECNGWWMDVLENGPSSPYASPLTSTGGP
ncbi:MAG TPA: alpha-amylase family glycosyl hydrolase [Aggregatilineales bacterium]|nr:alpha-amylase family glycosyl hydrolase [Aggregatilineales bacterium]